MKSGEDSDGGRVNVGSGVDNSNKLRIRLSGIKLTDDDIGVLSRRALKNNSLPLFQHYKKYEN
ncbi:hypothetical protein Tco_1233642, partial [Tanacetum coccineum]